MKESNPVGANYEVVWGTVTVEFSGTAGDCTIIGSSSIPEPGQPGGDHSFAGAIVLDAQNNKYAASGGAGDAENHVVWTCPDEVFTENAGGFGWVLTFNPLQPVYRPFTPGDPLQGSFDFEGPYPGATAHYEWSFDPVVCNSGPQPVCQ